MEKIMNSVINALTLEKIDPEAYGELAKSFEEAYEYIKKEGFKSDPYFRQNFSKISERWGVLDAWLVFALLATYAAGVATGQGRDKIKLEDVSSTKARGCSRWPACPVMRVEGFLKSLSLLMEWYDIYSKKRE